MINNRFFKTTMGIFAQLAIVTAVDASDGTAAAAVPATVSIPITIAADPTPGDLVNIVVDGVTYTHTVPVGDETTQQAHDAILALLGANSQGFIVASHSGTTSSVFNLAWAGSDKNTKAVTLTETGSTFTVAGPYAFAGGANADATAADSLGDFVTSGTAASIWAFWEDTKLALAAGDTFNPANINRKFFYAWKEGTVTRCSSPIPVRDRVYSQVAYNAGTAQQRTIVASGTFAATQIVHVRILENTATQLPFPSWDYQVTIGSGGINQALTDIAALITAETDSEKFCTASSSTVTLTIVSTDKKRTFKTTAYLETSPGQPTDLSVFTHAQSVAPVDPIGDSTTLLELAKYGIENRGGVVYAPEGTTASEFGNAVSNIVTATHYGFLLVSGRTSEDGVVRNYSGKPYILIAITDGGQATLAAL